MTIRDPGRIIEEDPDLSELRDRTVPPRDAVAAALCHDLVNVTMRLFLDRLEDEIGERRQESGLAG